MEAVGILRGVHGIDNGELIDVLREGELGEDRVEARVAIDAVDERDQLVLGGRFGEAEGLGEDAGFGAGPRLHRDIADGAGVVSNNDCGEAGGDTPASEGGGIAGDFGTDFGGDGGAIDELCSHETRIRGKRKEERGKRKEKDDGGCRDAVAHSWHGDICTTYRNIVHLQITRHRDTPARGLLL